MPSCRLARGETAHADVKEAGMVGRVLVAYATRYGSTQEVARAVADALTERGFEVDLLELKTVKDLSGYGAVVMGAPLQMFRWHKDAHAFLKRHRKALTTLPAAVFALGPIEDTQKDWEGVRAQLEKELAKAPWFSPVERRVFGGRFDPSMLGGTWKLLPGVKKLSAGDLRDWGDIAAWGGGLPETLGIADRV
jgi:menaquinone-dependent protoporphyrinogen oxidase